MFAIEARQRGNKQYPRTQTDWKKELRGEQWGALHVSAKELPVDGDDGSAYPDDDEDDLENERSVVCLGCGRKSETEQKAEEEWSP